MSEHTAEYVLVNDVVRRLAPAFPEAIPIFFWATREGNLTARESMSTLNFQVVTCFGRRPKLHSLADRILMKVNQQLLDYCRASSAVGIPVLAGLPLVRSLHLLRLTSHCCWFDLTKFLRFDGDSHVEVTLDGTEAAIFDSKRAAQAPLENEEIQTLVGQSPILTWDRAVELFTDIRRGASLSAQAEHGYFPFFGGYKPFHIVVPRVRDASQ